MRLLIQILGVPVLDIALLGKVLDEDPTEDPDEEPGDAEDELIILTDGGPIVADHGPTADALVGFYQRPYYEEEDRRHDRTHHPRVR